VHNSHLFVHVFDLLLLTVLPIAKAEGDFVGKAGGNAKFPTGIRCSFIVPAAWIGSPAGWDSLLFNNHSSPIGPIVRMVPAFPQYGGHDVLRMMNMDEQILSVCVGVEFEFGCVKDMAEY
jgi:hypothetical protein